MKKRASAARTRPDRLASLQTGGLKPFTELKGGARGRPPRFPGRTGGR